MCVTRTHPESGKHSQMSLLQIWIAHWQVACHMAALFFLSFSGIIPRAPNPSKLLA
jgi:hypothetical protein